ncbi:MAG: DUF86 domain-containing protein [Planctomycetota bacterium]
MSDEDLVRCRHILDAAREAVEHTHEATRADLDTDRKLQHTLIHLLEIIGEAAKAVSTECRQAHPEIQWRKMAGMRDRLAHGYWDINLTIVWRTVTEDLPSLITRLEAFLPAERD